MNIRALILSDLENLKVLKLSDLESLRTLKASNLATETIWEVMKKKQLFFFNSLKLEISVSSQK